MNMYTRRFMLAGLTLGPLVGFAAGSAGANLRQRVVNDSRLEHTLAMATKLVGSGLTAGSGYSEVWIRDVNTFIELGLRSSPQGVYRDAIVKLLLLQGPTGDIPDGYVQAEKRVEDAYRASPALPGIAAHKNTVETDQESSLVQAVARYIRATGDHSLLAEMVAGRSVLDRLDNALNYVMAERWSPVHGLAWSGAKIDWGDVQPEDLPGTHFNANSHQTILVYDNALLAIAMGELARLHPLGPERIKWRKRRSELVTAIRRHLWRGPERGFLPHLYLAGSPFPVNFNGDDIYYHGGTTVAIEAGVLTDAEIAPTLARMRRNVRAAGAGSIGLTVYPPYPAGLYRNPILTQPYTYQNGGDWDWFGGRLVRVLAERGRLADAYQELSPMLDRILAVGDFPEWWTRDNRPTGSPHYRGSAGVVGTAILAIQRASKR